MTTILGDHIKTKKGYAFKSEWYSNTGHPIIKVSDFTDNSVDTSTMISIPDDIANNYLDYEVKKNDVIIQTVGSWPRNPMSVVGKAIRIPSQASGALLNQNAVRIIPDNSLDNIFLFYLLRDEKFKSYIINTAQGAANQASITLDSIKHFVFDLPSLSTQRKIAAILSAYDDLIENNLQRIKIMEEIAQNLYTEWFVKFRFPGHEKVGMVDSALGMIPKEWQVVKLGAVLTTLESGSRPKGGVSSTSGEIPSIGAENIIGLGKYDYSKDKYVTSEFFNKMTKGHVKNGDVLLYKDGAQIGRKTMFRNGFPYHECCVNEHVFILRVKETIGQNYLYFWLDRPDMTQNIKNLNANSAQPGINQEGIKGLQILTPDTGLLKKFDQICDPILDKLSILARVNNILRQNRDLLLPRLISGQLDVSDLDIKTGNDE